MFRRWAKLIFVLALLAIGLAVPYLVERFYVNLVSEVMIYGLLAMSIDILAGYTGLTSMGHAGIFGVSAYVAGYLLTKSSIPAFAALPIGVLASTIAAALFAGVRHRRGEWQSRHHASRLYPGVLAVLLFRALCLCGRRGSHVSARQLALRLDAEGDSRKRIADADARLQHRAAQIHRLYRPRLVRRHRRRAVRAV